MIRGNHNSQHPKRSASWTFWVYLGRVFEQDEEKDKFGLSLRFIARAAIEANKLISR